MKKFKLILILFVFMLMLTPQVQAQENTIKASAMPEVTSMAESDVFPIVVTPGTTPVNKRITKANLGLVRSTGPLVALTQNNVSPNIIVGTTHKTNNTSTTLYNNFLCGGFGCAEGSILFVLVGDDYTQLDCSTGSLVCNRGLNYIAKASDTIEGRFSDDYGWLITINPHVEVDPVLTSTPSNTGTGTTLTGPRRYYYCSGTCTVGLPDGPTAGKVYEFCVMNLPGVSTAITLSAATNRYYGKPDQSGYGTQTSGTLACAAAVGNKLCVSSVDATHYMVISYSGVCTAN